jgi:glycosyltransferase involved in cell wall biosynthesis
MKVCILSENYQKGGIDTFLFSLMSNWPDPNDEITFLLNKEHSSKIVLQGHFSSLIRFILYKNLATTFTFKLVQLQESSTSRKRIKLSVRFKSLFIFLQFPTLVVYFYLKFQLLKFDRLLVVNGGYPGGINSLAAVAAWKLQHREGAILTFHNYAVKPTGIRKIVEYPLDFLMSKSIGQLVSVSADCLNSISTRPFLSNFKTKRVIYNGINDPSRIPKKEGASEIRCLMIGTFESRKGHSFLLESFQIVLKNINNAQLHLVGTGTEPQKMKILRKIETLGLKENVILHGFVQDVYPLIQSSAVVLVPSQAFESFGLTIIEAMAMGVPVIATDVGGIPEVLSDNSGGVICSHKDSTIFASEIIKVLNDKGLAKKMGEAGRKMYESKYTSRQMASEYHRLISK